MKATTYAPQTTPASTQSSLDITRPAHTLLKTLQTTQTKFGISYLVHLVQGDDKFGLKDEAHRQLPTFGALKETYSYKIRQVIGYLIVNQYIATRLGEFPTCYLTDKGKEALQAGEEFHVSSQELNRAETDRALFERLRAFRHQAAEARLRKPFEIFWDKTLLAIVQLRPKTLDTLRQAEGMTDYKITHFGVDILNIVQEVMVAEAQQKAKMPMAQAIKNLFQSGKSTEEIAQQREISPATVQNYLEMLHRAGEIDLISWAEEHMDPDALYRGTEYFAQAQNPRLQEAYEILGLDYNTLRLCRLYVSSISSRSEEVTYAVAS